MYHCFHSLNNTGGDGKIGKVTTLQNYRTDGKERNAVKVTWPNTECNMYKLGYRGKVDLVCVEEVPGMDYYRDHLFPLSKSSCIEVNDLQAHSNRCVDNDDNE